MKKSIMFIVLALACSTFAANVNQNGETYTDTGLTITVSTNTAVATYAASGENRVVFPMALFQTVTGTTQTNTVTLTITPKGSTSTYTVDTLAAVVSGSSTLEVFGIGDVTADVDPIWLTDGDVLTVTGAGTASSNVVYRLRRKTIQQ